MKKKMEEKIKPLSKEQSTATMAIKCYHEQLSSDKELIDAIHSISSEELHIIAIKHNKSKKDHWHVLVRGANRDKKFWIPSTLRKLTIQFRDGIDDELWNNRGAETVGDFSNYATYLLHKTIAAKRAGKAPYDEGEFITNLSPVELQRVLNGYSITKKPLTATEYNTVIDKAKEIGYELQNVDDFISSLQISGLNPTKESQIRKAYLNGVKDRLHKHERIYRLLIEIYSINSNDIEKFFYAAEKALADKRISISRGNMPIMLDPSKEAIITTVSNASKELFSDYICEVGKPFVTEKTIWAGNTVVMINDLWDNLDKISNTEKFFNCYVKDNKLICKFAPTVSLPSEEIKRLKDEYKKFRDRFNVALNEYEDERQKNQDNFDDIND